MAFSLVPNVGAPGRLQWSGVPQAGWIDSDVTLTSNITPTYTHNAAAVRYVSPTGNDTTGDGSSGLPYLTIAKALADVQAGGLIILDAGTYAMPTPFNCNAQAQIWIVGDTTSGAVIIDGANTTLVIGVRGSDGDPSRRDSPFRFRYINFINLAGLSSYSLGSSPGMVRRPIFMDCNITFSSLGHQANMFNGALVEPVDFISCNVTNGRINTSLNSSGVPLSIAGGTFPANRPSLTNGASGRNDGFRFYNCTLTNCGFDGVGGWINSSNQLSGGVTRLWGCRLVNTAIPFTGLVVNDLQGSKIVDTTDAANLGILFVWLSKVFMRNDGYGLEYSSSASNTQLNTIYFSGDNATLGPNLKVYRNLLFALLNSPDAHPLHPNRTNPTNTIASSTINNAANTIGYSGKGNIDGITGLSSVSLETVYQFDAIVGHPDSTKIEPSTRIQGVSAMSNDLPTAKWRFARLAEGSIV